MDVVATTKRSVAIAMAAIALAMLVLLAWIGGEQHYRSCLDRVTLEYPVSGPASAVDAAARSDAVDGCSRWP
jgi:hypothetical protein